MYDDKRSALTPANARIAELERLVGRQQMDLKAVSVKVFLSCPPTLARGGDVFARARITKRLDGKSNQDAHQSSPEGSQVFFKWRAAHV